MMELPPLRPSCSSSAIPDHHPGQEDVYQYSPAAGGPSSNHSSQQQQHHHHHHHHRHRHHHHHHHHHQHHRPSHTRSFQDSAPSQRPSTRIIESGFSSPVEEEGLSWRYARGQIWMIVESILAAKFVSLPPLSSRVLEAIRLGPQYLILYCLIILVIAYSVVPGDRPNGNWLLVVLLVLNFAFNIVLDLLTTMCRDREDIFRLYDALHTYKEAMSARESSFLSPLMRRSSQPYLKQGSPLVSIYPVYRDGQWQRVPTLMLVKGDLIALATGDVAPVKVEPYLPGFSTDLGGPISGLRGDSLEAGERIKFRAEHREPFTRKCSLTPSSRSLLLLCGDMRCFLVCQTPIENFLYEALRPSIIKPTEPLISKHFQVITGLTVWAMLIFISAHVVIATFRLIMYSSEQSIWIMSILVEPVNIALLFLPLSSPALCFFAEAISTARLLTVLDKLQLVASQKAAAAAVAAQEAVDDKARPQQPQDKQQRQHSDGDEGENGEGVDHDDDFENRGPASEQSFDELDADQRVNLRSKKASQGRISATRFGQYFSATLRARLLLPWVRPVMLADDAPLHEARAARVGSEDDMHFALSIEEEESREGQERVKPRVLLPVPLARARMVERLGAVTMVTVVDDELVCESSAPEELFLLNSKEEHEAPSTILRVMHDSSNPGSQLKFEEPTWWQHMPTLKPLGFTCLASNLSTSYSASSTTGPDPCSISPPPELEYQDLCADELLVRYASQAPPRRQYLADLGREVGFCEEDLATFRMRFRVHVFAPHLADEMAQEDTHALSVEETRHRGTLQPHVTSVVAEDRRNGGMHLLSQGNPSLLMPMCFDYWDGRVLNALSAEDRHLILERHQHWVLEDFDVMALCYTPVPLSMQKAIASRAPVLSVDDSHHSGASITPLYLVDNYTEAQQLAHLSSVREQANKERQARREALHEAATAAKGEGKLEEEDQDNASAATTSIMSPTAQRQDSEDLGIVMKGIKVEISGGGEAEAGRGRTASGQAVTEEELVLETPDGTVHGGVTFIGGLKSPPTPTSISTTTTAAAAGATIPPIDVEKSVLHNMGAGMSSRSSSMPPLRRISSADSERGSRGVEASLVADRLRTMSIQPRLKEILSDRAILSPCPSEPGRRASLGGAGGAGGTTPRLKRANSLDNVYGAAGSGDHRQSQAGGGASDEAFWLLLQKQVFLGLVASNVLPKKDVPGFVEEVMAAGVRFVYFSPRNMRRTKSLAEKMGIETGWNCAISLRPLESSGVPDEHRLVGEDIYGEWDVKARLPHGVDAIRKHLDTVDNVPLLVSLFTDSTPGTISEMFGIFHGHHESVLCVGYGFRETNARLFRRADLSISLEGLPGLPDVSSLPTHSRDRFSACDATFNEDVISLSCAFSLRHGYWRHHDPSTGIADRKVSVSLLLDLIREGRRVLANLYQIVAMAAIVIFTAATYIVMARLVPIPQTGTIDGLGVLWLLWVVLPAISLPFLDTQADAAILTRCPRKNAVKSVEIARALSYLLVRCIPSVLTCIYVHTRTLSCLLSAVPGCGSSTRPNIAPYDDSHWWAVLHCPADMRHPLMSKRIGAATKQADDVALSALVLILTVQSAGVLYRTSSIRQEVPFRNLAWLVSSACLLVVQMLHLLLRALQRQTHGHLLYVEWDVWLVMGVMPFLILLLGEYVKASDKKVFDRFMLLLKLEFNTRLGTHSPR